MILSLADAFNLGRAISSLQQFRFTYEVTTKIARNLRALNLALPNENKQKQKILKKHGQPTEVDENFKYVIEDYESWVAATTIEVDLELVTKEDLVVGIHDYQNHISITLMCALLPMVDMGIKEEPALTAEQN